MAACVPTKPAKEILNDVGEGFVTCAICLEFYRQPKLLPCDHTFCCQCLETLVEKKGSLNCPVCNGECELVDGDVSTLNDNHVVNSLLEVIHRKQDEVSVKKLKCEFCDENHASHFCLDCSQYFCESCVTRVHKNLKVVSFHTVFTTEEYRELKASKPSAAQPKEFCKVHPQNELKCYCDTCQIPICMECTLCDHKIPEHKFRYIQEVAEEYTEKLSQTIDKLKVKAQEAEDSKTVAKETIVKFKELCLEEEKRIQSAVEAVTEKVKVESKKLVQELKTTCDQHQKHLEVQIDDLEFKYENITSTCKCVETLMYQNNGCQLLRTRQATTQRLNDLAELETNPEIMYEKITFQASDLEQFTVQNMVGVLRSDVCVPRCTIDNIPKQLLKGESAKLVITTRDSRGKVILPHQDVKVNVTQSDGSQEEIEVTDNGDGTHTGILCGKTAGKLYVRVRVGDIEIPGCPYEVDVIKGLVKTIGKWGTHKGNFQNPRGIAMNNDGDMVVADSGNHRLQVIDIDGNCKQIFEFTEFDNPFFPYDVAVSADNLYFTTDRGNNQIVVSDANGKLVRCFGQNELKYPFGIAISPLDGSVYVTEWDGKDYGTDQSRHLIRKYSQDDEYIRCIGSYGTGEESLQGPCYMQIDHQGYLYICDFYNHHIEVLNSNDQFIHRFGEYGSNSGEMKNPSGLTMSKARYVYICDWNNHICKFDAFGQFICRVDRNNDGLNKPQGMTLIEGTPLKIVVVDRRNHCIKVFVE
ncbi:E3 ubiquitin-protein ligase TRIM45-like [Glandiceps talaboti]